MSLWAEIGLHTTLYWGVHQFIQADPVSFQQAWSSGKHTWDTECVCVGARGGGPLVYYDCDHHIYLFTTGRFLASV